MGIFRSQAFIRYFHLFTQVLLVNHRYYVYNHVKNERTIDFFRNNYVSKLQRHKFFVF